MAWSHTVYLDYEQSFWSIRVYGQIGWAAQDAQIDFFTGLPADELNTPSARVGLAGER